MEFIFFFHKEWLDADDLDDPLNKCSHPRFSIEENGCEESKKEVLIFISLNLGVEKYYID